MHTTPSLAYQDPWYLLACAKCLELGLLETGNSTVTPVSRLALEGRSQSLGPPSSLRSSYFIE